MSTPVNKYYLRSGEEPADDQVTAASPTQVAQVEEEIQENNLIVVEEEIQPNESFLSEEEEIQPNESILSEEEDVVISDAESEDNMASHITITPFNGNPGERADQ